MAKKNKASGKKKAFKDGLPPGLFSALTQAARTSRSVLARRLSTLGLFAGQDAVMLALAAEDGQTPSAIAASLGVRAPTVTKTISRLAAQGFVRKQGSESDGRLAHIFLTEAGLAAIASIRAAIAEAESEAMAGLSGKEARALVKLLRRVDANLHAIPLPAEPEAHDSLGAEAEKEGVC